MTTEKKTKIIAVRVTAAMRKKLEDRAKKGYRTISQEIEMVLSKELRKKTDA